MSVHVIDWVHDFGKDWARYLRRKPSGWPRISLMGKIQECGSVGAAIRAHEQIIPIDEMPEDVEEFHRAWAASPPRVKRIIYVFYNTNGPPREKARVLGISTSTLYARLGSAHAQLWALMDTQNRFQKVQ